MRGQRLETIEEMRAAVRNSLWCAGAEFYRKVTLNIHERWEKFSAKKWKLLEM